MPDDVKLPEPPMIVCAETRSRSFSGTGPKWFTWSEREKRFFCSDSWYMPRLPEDMEVVPHPRNSPEAVELIERSKE